MEAVIGALVGAVVGLIISLVTTVINNRTTIKVIEAKLDEQNKKIEKHNNLVERTYKLEEDMVWVKREIQK